MSTKKLLKTKAERLAYIEKCVKRGIKEREKARREAIAAAKEDQDD